MLSLMDPVEIEDLVVFRDDGDSRKFYLLPDRPVIPLDDQGVPEFLFIKYIKDLDSTPDSADAGGGWVQFRCALTIDPAREQRVKDALHTRLEEEKAAGKQPFGNPIDSTDPLLAAPLWSDGKVSLATFKATDTGLVRHATDTVPADLAGDLGASLALELDPDGAEIFWSAFQGTTEQQLPILVTYQLTYKARVSAKMEIHASRDVIHQEIWKWAEPYRLLRAPFVRYVKVPYQGTFEKSSLVSLRASFAEPIVPMILRPQLGEVIHKTIVDNKITVRIETDQAGSGDDADKVRDLMFKVATEVLSDRLIPALFGDGSTQPGADSAGDATAGKQLLQVPEDGGDGTASFDLTLDEQSTLERPVNPNGPVQILIASPQALASCFRELRLSDGFFSAMKVTASTAGVNFERDGLDSIHVFFRYEQQDEASPDKPWVRRSQDGMLRSEKDALYWRFDTARDAGGGHKRGYEFRMDVFYREGPPSATGCMPRSDRMLTITPHAMGALRVELVLTAGKDRVASARVALKHLSQQPGAAPFQAALELTPDANKRTWFQYTGELTDSDLTQPEYTYQVRYRVADGEIVMPEVRSTAQSLEIPSPFKKVISFILRPQGSFDGVANISGDVVYEDAAHQYLVRRSFALGRLTDSYTFEVPILEGGPEAARWAARLNRADGSALDLAPGQGAPGTVWLGTEIDFLSVQILPDLIDFDHDVQLAVVELSYHDAGNGIAAQQTFTFSKTARAQQLWKVGRRDHNADKYDVDIRYIAYDRAKSSEVHQRQVQDQVLLLDRSAGTA